MPSFNLKYLTLAMIIVSSSIFSSPSVVKAQLANHDSESTSSSGNSKNFSIALHSIYTVTANGKTIVEQKITIKNKSPELFVSKYGIVVSSTNLSNIETSYNGRAINFASSKQKGQTSIGVSFDEQVVGEGKSSELVIRYTDSDIALISGKVLEVNIPQLSDHAAYDSYQLELRVPSIFGTPSRTNPNNFILKQDGDYNIITYTNLQNQAVSAIFGNQQFFDLHLNYYLNNQTSQNALTQITLPPETPYQKVDYRNLDPMPQSIKEDQDGNFIATYEIPANNSYNVELFAQVKLDLRPDPLVPFSQVLPEHLTKQKFWESNDPTILAEANKLQSVKDIYDFVVKTLNYTKKPLTQDFTRLGAGASLSDDQKNNATCQEFTDLFIALARAKQIPARRVVGIAYSNNEELRPSNLETDILHTWPEYYDATDQAWHSVDPTWEDTTGGIDYFNNFDLNHIALAINGISSTMPYPAGTYSGNQDEKNKKITLELAKTELSQIQPDLTVNLINKKIYGLNLNITGNYDLEIFNPTGQVWYFSKIDIAGEQLEIISEQKGGNVKILPFSKLIIPLTIYNTAGNTSRNTKIQVLTQLKQGQSTSHEFDIRARAKIKIQNPERIAVVGGGFVVLTLLAGSLLLLGRQVTNSLHRQGQKFEEESQQLQEVGPALGQDPQNDKAGKKSRASSARQRN